MVKHIVFWKLKDEALNNSKETNARLLKEKLEALDGRIPDLLSIEVGFDISRGERSADVALYSEFPSAEALAAYQKHPLHLEVVTFVVEIVSERRVVDYEV